jgi:hypothetical protein
MKARDAPENAPFSAPQIAPIDTGISKPVKSSQLMTKRTRKPAQKTTKKPPSVTGYTWRKDGAGWQLRRTVYESDDTGIRKRRLPYVAHLSKSAFAEMKRQHQGAALERAIAEWIAEHDK